MTLNDEELREAELCEQSGILFDRDALELEALENGVIRRTTDEFTMRQRRELVCRVSMCSGSDQAHFQSFALHSLRQERMLGCLAELEPPGFPQDVGYVLRLSERDSKRFADIMAEDFEPNEALMEAGRRYQSAIDSGALKIR